MKKIYISFIALGLAASVSSQNKEAAINSFNPFNGEIKKIENTDKALGDTLFWCPLVLYYINPTDSSTFTIQTEDVDGLPLNSNLPAGLSQDFGVFYSTDAEDIDSIQGDVDTAFFWYAVSWFDSPAQASNWLTFGPITIPAGGADIKWKHRMPDASFRDGYRVLVNPFGLDDIDFSDPPIFTRSDNQTGLQSDTNWTEVSATVPMSYAGQQVYFAFHHNANDMFLLYLDDIRVTEANNSTTSINHINGVKLLSSYPNPFRINTFISFELQNTAEVVLEMFDLSGKMVMQHNAGTMIKGLNRIEVDGSSLPAGVYYYTLTLNGEKTSAQKIIKM